MTNGTKNQEATMNSYRCWDGFGEETIITAENAVEAARKYSETSKSYVVTTFHVDGNGKVLDGDGENHFRGIHGSLPG